MLFFALPYAARANEPNIGAATSRAMHTVRPTQANHEIVRHVGISKVLDRFEKGFGFAFHDANLARPAYCVKYVNAPIRKITWQLAPLATGLHNVQARIKNTAHVGRARPTAASLERFHERLNQHFRVSQSTSTVDLVAL
jgi:hypothetical protein